MIGESFHDHLPHLLPVQPERHVGPAVPPRSVQRPRQNAGFVLVAVHFGNRQLPESGFDLEMIRGFAHAGEPAFTGRRERAIVGPACYVHAGPQPLDDLDLHIAYAWEIAQHVFTDDDCKRLDLIAAVLMRQRVHSISDRLVRFQRQRRAAAEPRFEVALEQ